MIPRDRMLKARSRPTGSTAADEIDAAYFGVLLPFYGMRYRYDGAEFPEELFQAFKAACVAFARAHARYEKVLGNQIARINSKGRNSDAKRATSLEWANMMRKLRWDIDQTYDHLVGYRERGEAPPKEELSPVQWLGVSPQIHSDMKKKVDGVGR
jgi:hypothetical protein